MVGIASKTTVWYSTGLFAEPLRWVLVVRDPRDRFKTQALLLCTDLEADPQKALSRLVIMRWPAAGSCWQLLAAGSDLPGGGTKASGIREAKAVVVRFGDTADHIGVAVRAVLGGHFVCASAADTGRAGAFGQAAWHHKTHPTFFSDGLALVRKELWAHGTFCESSQQTDTVKVPRAFVERLTDAVCYAAWWLKSSTKGDLGNPDHRI